MTIQQLAIEQLYYKYSRPDKPHKKVDLAVYLIFAIVSSINLLFTSAALKNLPTVDHSYFGVTSDHGELFERGENGHNTFLLYDSVIHIPLLISAPQQTQRQDFHSLTSNIDVLPTLLNIVRKEIPSSLEGRLLPGSGGVEDGARSIFAVEAKTNSAFAPLKRATFTLMKENYKVIYYGDYPRYSNVFELYDLFDDIDEKRDLFAEGPAIVS